MIKIGLANIVVGTILVLFGVALVHEFHLLVGYVVFLLGVWVLWTSITDDNTPLPGA